MPQTSRKPARAGGSREDVFDRIVADAVAKSVVTAPSDPNGGAKLPQRQEGAPKRKGRTKTQYMAIFDRDAQHSDDQLEDWEESTNDTTRSPEKFVNDDDDVAEDPDEEDEDARGNEVYDPYSDDDEDDDPGEDTVPVRAHRRKKVRKSAVAHDHDGGYEGLSDDDDDDLDENDEDDEDEDEKPRGRRARKGMRKAAGEDAGADGTNDEDEEEEEARRDRRKGVRRAQEGQVERRKAVRKALGADYADAYDGVPVLKALTDRVEDNRDEMVAEVRQLRSELRRVYKALRAETRANAEAMAKSLATAYARMTPGPMESGEPVRKGVVASGEPASTTRKTFTPGEKFNLAKSLDVLDAAFEKGEIEMKDAITLENDRHPMNISRKAQEILRAAGQI